MEHVTHNMEHKKNGKHKVCSMFHMSCSMKQRGFTMIELIFSMAMFLIILGVTLDIFISIVQQQERILAEQELLSQASYAIEYMSRALRVAAKDPTGTCLGSAGDVYLLTHCSFNGSACGGIKFINALDNNACEEFFLDTAGNPSNPTLKFTADDNESDGQSLISDTYKINTLGFIINGNPSLASASSTDTIQPRITMLLNIQTQNLSTPIDKIIQTTVSQRNLNVP